MVGGRRDSERLRVGPSAAPMIEALTRRLRSSTGELVVQSARSGPWTAFYAGTHLIALARPSATGGTTALDVAAPAIDWACTLTKAADLDDDAVAPMLDLAVRRAPGWRAEGVAELAGTGLDPVSATFALVAILAGFVAWVLRTRRERALAAATGRQRELAILNAARREIGMRASSLTLGCLGALVTVFLTFLLLTFVAGWLRSVSRELWPVALVLYLVPLALALVVFWRVRRRYPSPPRARLSRKQVVRNVLGFAVAVVVLLVLGGIANR